MSFHIERQILQRSNSKTWGRLGLGLVGLVAVVLGLRWWGTFGEESDANTDPIVRAEAPVQEGTATTAATRPVRRSDADPWKAPRAVVAGTVRDQAGQPIAGAQVCARLQDAELAQTERFPPPVRHHATRRHLSHELVSIDDQPITGLDAYRMRKLSRVPPGTALSLGVRTGDDKRIVRLVAGEPR